MTYIKELVLKKIYEKEKRPSLKIFGELKGVPPKTADVKVRKGHHTKFKG